MPDVVERLSEEAGRDDLAYRTVTVLMDGALEIERLRDLIQHCWVHSGYRNCGYDQMTTPQKALYDATIRV